MPLLASTAHAFYDEPLLPSSWNQLSAIIKESITPNFISLIEAITLLLMLSQVECKPTGP